MPKKLESPETSKASLSVHRHFRLSTTEDEALKFKVAKSKLTTSNYLRQAVLTNATTIVLPDPKILTQLLKMGNNLNQLAHQVNTAYLQGKISESLFQSILERIQDVHSYAKLIAKPAAQDYVS